MKFISEILVFVLASSSPIRQEGEGGFWVPVERKKGSFEQQIEDDESGWVVFSKNMGGEKFLVRFPDDPQYAYHEEGIQIRHVSGQSKHTLDVREKNQQIEEWIIQRVETLRGEEGVFVVKAESSDAGTKMNLLYLKNGRCILERIDSTEGFVYTFRTESSEIRHENHGKFIDSFEVFS